MKISIIIATFNAELRLSRCLDSIISQKTEEIELLIIDGGSVDGTLKLIDSYKGCIDFVLSEKDNGIYDAWNKGLRQAKGEWIMFLGADDQLMPGVLGKYLQFICSIEGKICDYISARINYCNADGRLIKVIGKAWKWSEFKDKMTVAHVASLHNRSLFNQVGLFDTSYRICADYELLMRKRDKLAATFFSEIVASMESGGVSFSTAAIKETCRICNYHNENSFLKRCYLFMRKHTEFYFFILKMKLRKLLHFNLYAGL